MKENTRKNLKTYFENGDRPTEEQFKELIDSFVNKLDDEVYIILPQGKSEKRVGLGTKKPKTKLDVRGAIKIGTTGEKFSGVIRWTGSDFEGFDGQLWRSLTKDQQASHEIFIPEPHLQCTADRLYAYWTDCVDRRFLDFNPSYWLYRYKSRIKQTYKDKSKRTRVIPKKWAHTQHQDRGSHNNPRNTEFPVSGKPGQKQFLNIEPIKWFKPIPGGSRDNYWIPKGQGMHPVPKKEYFNRRFEYFRIRMVISVNGKLVYGPFSEIFSLGYRRRYYSNSDIKKYKSVFELAEPGKGMNRSAAQ